MDAESVAAILAGHKTQTRRVVKTQLIEPPPGTKVTLKPLGRPYGAPGDVLWVKERWFARREFDSLPPSRIPHAGRGRLWYAADGAAPPSAGRARSSIFMPRWASRILLQVTDVRLERLQAITVADAQREGGCVETLRVGQLLIREWFRDRWDGINAKRGFGWDRNPCVFVVTFRRLACPAT